MTNLRLAPLRSLHAILLVAICTIGTPCRAETPTAGEYQVKAAMIVNIAKFVDWPPSSAAGSGNTFTICTAGAGSFASALEAYRGKTVRGKTVTIRRYELGDDPSPCSILLTGEADRRHLAAILASVRGKPVLTIGDSARFATTGGMIGFFEQDGKVRFEINQTAAEKAGLRLGAQLLKLARVVGEKEK